MITKEIGMARRKIKRRRGEGIAISGPATIHVSRRVLLIVEAPREARVARLAKHRGAASTNDKVPNRDGADGRR
jgi:hypothetical protein